MSRAWSRRRWLAAWPGLAAMPAWPGEAARTAPGTLIDWPELRTLDGAAFDHSVAREVPSVVVFWATWCAFCRRHNAHLDKLYRSVDARRLRILGVALDTDTAAVHRYLASTGYGFPVLLDAGRLRQRFTERRVIPMTCTLDRHGRLLQCFPGEMAESDVLDLARLALPAAR